MDRLSVVEKPLVITPNERVLLTYTTTPWLSSPTSSAVKAYDITNGDTDVTTTLFPTNTPTESGDVISLSLIRGMTLDHKYRLEITFVVGDGTYEFKDYINCDYYYKKGGPLRVSADEILPIVFTTTALASSPTSPVITAFDITQGDSNVTTTVFPTNSPSVSGDDITCSPMKDMTKNHRYRVNCKFTVSTEIFDLAMLVNCIY